MELETMVQPLVSFYQHPQWCFASAPNEETFPLLLFFAEFNKKQVTILSIIIGVS